MHLKKLLVASLISLFVVTNSFAGYSNIENEKLHHVLVFMKNQINTDSLMDDFRSKNTLLSNRIKITINELKNCAKTQKTALNLLHQKRYESEVSYLKSYYIINCIELIGTSKIINKINELKEVDKIIDVNDEYVFPIVPITGENEERSMQAPGGTEPGLLAIDAHLLWQMGYTGNQRLLYSVDTGVWPQHPAIGNRFLANYYPMSQCWLPFDSPIPIDKSNSHGTHTIGTALGLATQTSDTIGVAPGAYFIATDPIVQNLNFVKPITVIMSSFEWALNPDGDVNTTNDVPDVINNSWGIALTPQIDTLCNSTVSLLLNVVETAGIVAVFSAGNEGPGQQTVGRPAFLANSIVNAFSVGALNGNIPEQTIASFSSRGPSVCGGSGSLLIKPEVSAPGVNVRSCVGTSGYSQYSGTSMAGPHVTGAVLLLREAFPQVSAEEIKLALYYTALDLGEPGEDNTYGMGIINVKAAFDYLALNNIPLPPNNRNKDITINNIVFPSTGTFICNNTFNPIVSLKNNGTEIITQTEINYGFVGENQQSFSWSGSLASGESVEITLPEISTSIGGNKEFLAICSSGNLTEEYDLINNRRISRFGILSSNDLPFSENFENGLNNGKWIVIDYDGDVKWDTAYTFNNGGNYSAVIKLNSSINFNNTDDLISPKFSFLNIDTAKLEFKVGYKLRNTSASDSLIVKLSTDCGQTFPHTIYRKGGSNLSTSSGSISDYVPQTNEDWRKESISLHTFSGNENIVIKFIAKNRKGNYISLDDINLFDINNNVGIAIMNDAKSKIYPNPTNKLLFVESHLAASPYVIADLTGKLVASGNNCNVIDLSNLCSGIYVLHINRKEFTEYHKIIVKH